MRIKTWVVLLLAGILCLLGILLITHPYDFSRVASFDADRAYKDLVYQVDLGPRIPGSAAHQAVSGWIQAELKKYGWETSTQNVTVNGKDIENIAGKKGNGKPVILLGAHYDSRLTADQDPEIQKRALPVPGANDGASGVAVLLELARVLPEDDHKEIWLVFFDAEDQGDIPGWTWIMGSTAFAASLNQKPDQVVVLDMIGDGNLDIYYEKKSDPELMKQIWASAASLGYSKQFVPEYKYAILDDHLPFIELGVPSVDIIDFDYKYWHTTMDTKEATSAVSLKIVGDTLLHWLDGTSQN